MEPTNAAPVPVREDPLAFVDGAVSDVEAIDDLAAFQRALQGAFPNEDAEHEEPARERLTIEREAWNSPDAIARRRQLRASLRALEEAE
jgi:hypothetical protein